MNEEPGEVRAYVKRLVITIIVGILLMSTAATWAFRTYGARLNDAPPLPSGKPPINGVKPAQ